MRFEFTIDLNILSLKGVRKVCRNTDIFIFGISLLSDNNLWQKLELFAVITALGVQTVRALQNKI